MAAVSALTEWIAHSRPTLGTTEMDAARAVIDSRYLARGNQTQRFEESIARHLRMAGGRAVASGTCALQLALLSLVPRGQRKSLSSIQDFFRDKNVLIPAYCCSAVLYAVEWTGATVEFVDIDPETWSVDPRRMLESSGESTVAAVVAPMFGLPGPARLPETENLVWIEDIAQSLGAGTSVQPTGSRGQLTACSFYATKVMTTGTGGMILARDKNLLREIDNLLQYDNQDDDGLHLSWQMGDLQAALGLVQWSNLQEMVQRRRRIAEAYSRAFFCHPEITALPVTGNGNLIEGHIYFRYTMRLRGSAERFMEEMRQQNIEVKRPVYVPLYRLRGGNAEDFPATEEVFRSTVSLPIYPELSDSQMEWIIEASLQALESCAV